MKRHKVRQGECLASIADHYRFRNWRTVYEAPENKEFRKKRPNPNVIYPGDEIVIPDVRRREELIATEAKHRFRAKTPRWVFRLQMLDNENNPIDNEPYLLRVHGEDPVEDKTTADGMVEVRIKAQAKRGTLFIIGDRFDLRLGHLDPVARVQGVQQRLANLGYYRGAINGRVGKKTREAVMTFQSAQDGLKPKGIIDDETRKRLLEVHDNDGEVVDAEEEMSERSEEEPRPSATVPPCGDEPLQATEGDEESEESLSCSQGPGEPTP